MQIYFDFSDAKKKRLTISFKLMFLLLLCITILSCEDTTHQIDSPMTTTTQTNVEKQNRMSTLCGTQHEMSVRWDFSQGHEYTNATGFDDVCYLEKDILGLRDSSLELLLPENISIGQETFQSILVIRSGLKKELVRDIHIDYISTPMTIDETYTEMHKIAEKYDIPTDRLESWYSRIQQQTGPFVRPSFISRPLGDDMHLQFDMAYSPAYDKPAGTREYVINLLISWNVENFLDRE